MDGWICFEVSEGMAERSLRMASDRRGLGARRSFCATTMSVCKRTRVLISSPATSPTVSTMNKSSFFFVATFPLPSAQLHPFHLNKTHPVVLSSSRPCSKADSSWVMSTFFLQAFFPFLDFCPCWAGAPMFTPLPVPVSLPFPLPGRSYGFVVVLDELLAGMFVCEAQ